MSPQVLQGAGERQEPLGNIFQALVNASNIQGAEISEWLRAESLRLNARILHPFGGSQVLSVGEPQLHEAFLHLLALGRFPGSDLHGDSTCSHNQVSCKEKQQCSLVPNVNKFYSDFRAISKWTVARNDFDHLVTRGRKGETCTGIGIPRSLVNSVTL